MLNIPSLILNSKRAKRHPLETIGISFFYSSLSLLLSLWIFPQYASLVMVFFTVISCLYIVQKAFIAEENTEKKDESEERRIKEHFKTSLFLIYLFLGFVLSFTFWTIILPENTVELTFGIQKEIASGIRAISGYSMSDSSHFTTILMNNMRVFLLSLILALFYGAGAIFILAWNASIMGFVIGNLARNTFGLISIPLLFTKFFLHGLLEMLAYFGAALAGGIIFIAITRGNLDREQLKKTFLDVSLIIVVSILILILAAGVEVFISSRI